MAVYRFLAINKVGSKEKGLITADSLDAVKKSLVARKLVILSVQEQKHVHSSYKLSKSLLLSFTTDLSQLLRAALPLYESLRSIEEKYEGHKAQLLFADLCEKVKEGKTLSEAMKLYPETFSKVYCSIVKSAEESGDLAAAFHELSALLKRQTAIRSQVTSAMLYPAMMMTASFGILIALLVWMIPTMKDLFEGRELHQFTHFVIYISDILCNHGLMIITALVACIGCIILLFNMSSSKVLIDRLMLKMPLVSSMTLHTEIVIFSRVVSSMLKGGVPLAQALELSAEGVKNSYFRETIESAKQNLIQGQLISKAFKQSLYIPPLFKRMLATAEETANMEHTLSHIADIYEEKLTADIKQLTAVLQPVMILIVGAIVAFVLLSVLLPLTDVESFMNQGV